MCFVKRRGQFSPMMTEQKAGAGSVSPAAEMFVECVNCQGWWTLVEFFLSSLTFYLLIITPGYSVTRVFSSYTTQLPGLNVSAVVHSLTC